MKRRPLSAETKAKISATRRARGMSPAAHAATVANGKLSKGRKLGPMSPEHRAKLSAAQKGRPFTASHLAAVRAARERSRGVPLSPEHIVALTGRKATPEHRANMSKALKGRLYTPAHLEAARVAHKGKYHILAATIKGECVYCFHPAITRDHAIPRGRPGWDNPDNLVPACSSCNASKNQRTPEEWLAAGLIALPPNHRNRRRPVSNPEGLRVRTDY